ncbi:MAG: hypothetical protein AAF613_07850 [Pseudomonadota bacterium]
MIYQSWFAKKSGNPKWIAGLFLVFCLPSLSGIIGRAAKGKEIVGAGDFEAVACAGERVADGRPLYPAYDDFACEGMEAANYLYTPWVAELFAWVRTFISHGELFVSYQVLFWVGLAACLLVPVFFARTRGTILERATFLGFATGSIFYWSNIAGIILGLISATALLARWPIFLTLAILLAGAVKPTYLGFLAFILFLDISLFRRAVFFAAAVMIGLSPTLHFMFTGGELVTQWRDLLSFIGSTNSVGGGFFGWFDLFGLDGRHPEIPMTLYFPYAAVMVLCGFALAERGFGAGPMNRYERIWLGLAIGNLLNPRLLAYDLFMFAPGLVLLIYAAQASERTVFSRPLPHALAWLILGGTCLVTFMNVADMGDYSVQAGTALFALAIFIAGIPEILPALRKKGILPARGIADDMVNL